MGVAPVLAALRARPKAWIGWSTVGFGLFYAPMSFAVGADALLVGVLPVLVAACATPPATARRWRSPTARWTRGSGSSP